MVSGVNVWTRQMEALLSRKALKADINLKADKIWIEAEWKILKRCKQQSHKWQFRQLLWAVRVIREADLPAKPYTRGSIPEEHQRPRQVRSMMSQPVFNQKVPDRYVELLNVEMEVVNVLQLEAYDHSEEGKGAHHKRTGWAEMGWNSGRLTDVEKEAYKSATGLFNVLKKYLACSIMKQYCKLPRKENESTQEWMGRLCIKAAECKYNKHDRWLTGQFINGINAEEIMQEIIKELTTQRHMGQIDSEQVLMWA